MQWQKNYLRDKNRSGYDENMDMMKRKQLTSKDGVDVKVTKTDDQEQAWCKKAHPANDGNLDNSKSVTEW